MSLAFSATLAAALAGWTLYGRDLGEEFDESAGGAAAAHRRGIEPEDAPIEGLMEFAESEFLPAHRDDRRVVGDAIPRGDKILVDANDDRGGSRLLRRAPRKLVPTRHVFRCDVPQMATPFFLGTPGTPAAGFLIAALKDKVKRSERFSSCQL